MQVYGKTVRAWEDSEETCVCVCVCVYVMHAGLDARAAAIVMRAVRNVARNNRAVLVTIHQPSIEIFEAFDRLLLLQRGGRVTYFGPLGRESVHLVNYLEAVPGWWCVIACMYARTHTRTRACTQMARRVCTW